MKSDKYCVFCISLIKLLKKFPTIMEENMVVIKYPKSFCFNFDKNLKHEIQLVIKSNESLVKNKIKNEIE